MNNAIQEKLDALIETLEAQEEVKRFRDIQNLMENNFELKKKIDEYKKWQQRVVIHEHRTGETDERAEEKLDRLYNELLDIPILNEYLNLMNEINDVIQSITNIIEETINE